MSEGDDLDVVNDFESWARVAARLHGRDEDQVNALLDDLGLASVWANADATWSRTLVSEMEGMRLGRTERYAELLAEELRDRALTGDDSVDFRHRALYGERPSSTPRSVKQIGGTPFADVDDHEPTRRLRALDAQTLHKAPAVNAPTEDADADS